MDAKKLIQAIRDAGYDARSYSGRGMFGKSCVGIDVGQYVSGFEVGVKVANEYDGPPQDLAGLSVSEDGMGLGSIIYFSRVEWPADVPQRADDEDEPVEDDEQECEA